MAENLFFERFCAYVLSCSWCYCIERNVNCMNSLIESCAHERLSLYGNEFDADRCNKTALHRLVGASQRMNDLFYRIKILSNVPSTVLLRGESGTGKELVAEALHYCGNRSDKPLVKVNCPALKTELIESELFGHKKGSFTGATTDRTGRFEHANGGTIFLDEITELPLETQAKLLRVLQERTIERVGDDQQIKIDVRIIAATNRDIKRYIADGKFREDLYYRLNVFLIEVPSLRERKDDISMLAESFFKEYRDMTGKDIKGFSIDTMEFLKNYQWPGNVRQLRNCIEYACVLCNNNIITIKDLPLDIQNESTFMSTEPFRMCTISPLLVLETVKACAGNKTEAARQLGISRQSIYRYEKRIF
jgi:two-component system, NtrC family, response regulator HydG